MMRRSHRIWTLLLSIMLMIACMPFLAQEASAETEYRIDLPGTFWIGQDEEWLRLTDKDGGSADIDSITQSNKVFRVSKDKYQDENGNTHYDVYIRPVRTGSTRFTINYTDEDGAQRVMTTKKFRVKKYPKEIKSLIVNGHKIKTEKKAKLPNGKKADTRYAYCVKNKGVKARIKMKLNKGWKITDVSSVLSRGNDDDIRSYEKVTKKIITKQTVTNGKKIVFPKSWEELTVCVTMKKNGETIDYCVVFFRD